MEITNKILSKIKSIRSLKDISSVSKTLVAGHILKKKVEWNIAFTRGSWKTTFNKNKIISIPNPKNRWFADPFVIKKNKYHYIFFDTQT